MGPIGHIGYIYCIYWTVWDRYMQELFLGRAPRTKETLPDFLKWRRVTRPPLVFRRLTGSQRTPGFWGVTAQYPSTVHEYCWSQYKNCIATQSTFFTTTLQYNFPTSFPCNTFLYIAIQFLCCLLPHYIAI